MGRWNLSLAIIAWACAGLAQAGCPNATSLSPCTCDYYGINCMRAQRAGQLRLAFESGDAETRDHRYLWIQNTPIKSFRGGVLGSFKFENVHIDHNANLSNFTLDSLSHMNKVVVVLSLHGNALRKIEYDKLRSFTSLESLDLGGNKLKTVPPNAFHSIRLQRLSLMGNPIREIGAAAFFGLTNLTELILSHTRLMKLGGHSLSLIRANRNLKIDLSHARIKTIEETAFDAAMPLEVDLSHNNLTGLRRRPFEGLMTRMVSNVRGRELTPVVKVEGNPLTCEGCSYVWIVHSRMRKRIDRIFEGFKCPDGLNSTSLTAPKIRCKASWTSGAIG
ncbi:insulin-like growth factor-binding protein complex acid labile subunit [Rhipicephalus sanguineus]|uniref:insulin-like growth factor-binding protein complex acid labile subunit n=1 Tax=Rhipicephalus sanguineus TaxID=34632 RepID=UPI0020C36386|nr:insulin-like growth factor-binding protein complex acid labile subunit [Rhipicephalus sanguineus]